MTVRWVSLVSGDIDVWTSLTIPSIHAMRSRLLALVVPRLLIERESSVHIPVDGIAGIYGIESLRMVVAQMEVVDVFGKTIDIVIL